METVAQVFTDIAFLDKHSPYFYIRNGFKLFKEKVLKIIPKYGRTKAQSWPQGSKSNNDI